MSLHATLEPTVLPWTGERMIPNAADPATELFHWQRYLFFRPWYEDRRVIDAASGEGYGTGYAACFAAKAIGCDVAADAVAHASRRYPHAQFVRRDVCELDYSEADLVISFETIEHLSDPGSFLTALASCRGQIVISTPNRNTHSPGNSLGDQPRNGFHTIEWTPSEFSELVRSYFPDRQVRFLSQEARWPGLIREGLDENAMYTIAVIGDGDLPKWPRLGISIPTHNGAARVRECVMGMTKFYPGEIEFAIVANGCTPQTVSDLRLFREELPHIVHLIESSENLGYGRGANAGLDYLWQEGWFDYFGVSNDDVTPAHDCLPQLVAAMLELEKAGQKPGVIGPVTNEISGSQKVDIGSYAEYAQMLEMAELHHRSNHSRASQATQVRGLFLLIHPDCLNTVGGFDPRFGIGNFEDDDHNLRTRLAGFSLWIADGAFLHHAGSQTFKSMNIDYDLNIQRNLGLIMEKWGFADFNEFLTISSVPESTSLFVPLTATAASSGYTAKINGETIDLVNQASDMELAAYVMNSLRGRPRECRLALLEALQKTAA
jgi:GT2 family glycosyltransferase/SAM-dependent methyltransferase